MKSIINQMLKDPILQIKELAASPEGGDAIHYFEQIFNLVEEDKNEPQKQSVKSSVESSKLQPSLSVN